MKLIYYFIHALWDTLQMCILTRLVLRKLNDDVNESTGRVTVCIGVLRWVCWCPSSQFSTCPAGPADRTVSSASRTWGSGPASPPWRHTYRSVKWYRTRRVIDAECFSSPFFLILRNFLDSVSFPLSYNIRFERKPHETTTGRFDRDLTWYAPETRFYGEITRL